MPITVSGYEISRLGGIGILSQTVMYARAEERGITREYWDLGVYGQGRLQFRRRKSGYEICFMHTHYARMRRYYVTRYSFALELKAATVGAFQ